MKWLNWTIFAAVGCLPALALADEPAKKEKDEGLKVKFGLTIVVPGENGPKVLFEGGDSKNLKEFAQLFAGFAKRAQVKVADAKDDKKPPVDEAAVRQLMDQLAAKAMTLTLRVNHGEKSTFLGVGTSPPPTVLSKQLGLHDGMGLVADEVVPDGPAAKAGLKQYDVLEKLDDQLIINFEQLAVLVRSHKPGDEVKLTVIHEGKPAVLTAKLTEHEAQVGWAHPQEYELHAHVTDPHSPMRVWEIVHETRVFDKAEPAKTVPAPEKK